MVELKLEKCYSEQNLSEAEREEILMESKKCDPKPEVIYGLKKNAVTYKSTSKDERHEMN